MSQRVKISVLFPLLTQSQGDDGNARVLAYRLAVRGIDSVVTIDHTGARVSEADIVLLGGLDETGVDVLAQRLTDIGLTRELDRGLVVFAVNAGFVALGTTFDTAEATAVKGLGVFDVSFTRGAGATGPVVAECTIDGVPALSGYESRSSEAHHGADATAFASIVSPDGTRQHDGCVAGNVVGTFIHGPLLARNVAVADHLLSRALGSPLEPRDGGWAERVRAQRTAEDAVDPSGWAGVTYGQHSALADNPALRRLS